MERARNKKGLPGQGMAGKELVFGICGSIAAYKVPELIRLMRSRKANVRCILTKNGSRFITPLTLQTISCNKVYEGMFDDTDWDIEHISLAGRADIIVIVPASADCMARLASGRAEDLLSSVVLAAKKPVLICPAMNENMWLHPATQENVKRLKGYGYHFVKPEKGDLACGVEGDGRLAGLDVISEAVESILVR